MLFENRLFLFSLSMTTNEIAGAAHSRMMTAERTIPAILPRFNLLPASFSSPYFANYLQYSTNSDKFQLYYNNTRLPKS